MDKLNEVLLKEISYLKECGEKFINREISKVEFRGVSGGFGVYAHKDEKNFMIRLRVSSGVLSYEKLKTIYELAKKYNLEKIHLTTRQAIQLHGLSIDAICNIMKEAMEKGIYTRGGGGDYPRNVALSPLSGVDENEAFDVAPYSLAVDNHFIRKIYTYKLPRKLKVSFSNSIEDTAHATVQDLGFVAVNHEGKNYFNVFVGGGLGRNPAVGVKLPELVEPKDVLYHVEALTNLFMKEGDYEFKGRARVRYIVERIGKEKFLEEYKKYLEEEKKKGNLDLNIKEFDYNKEGIETKAKSSRLFKQKQSGLYSVYVHPIGGQLYLKDLEKILDFIKDVPKIIIRSSMTEGLYFLNLNGGEAERFLALTKHIGGETELEKSVSCIGTPICQMGILDSQSQLNDIINFFKEKGFEKDVLPKIFISGCPNSCGVHEIGSIGLSGKKKNINGSLQEVFELFIGGKLKVGETSLGKSLGYVLKKDVSKLLYEIALKVDESGLDFTTWVKERKDDMQAIVKPYIV